LIDWLIGAVTRSDWNFTPGAARNINGCVPALETRSRELATVQSLLITDGVSSSGWWWWLSEWRLQLQKLVRAWLAICMAPRWPVGCATEISTGRRRRATSPVWPRNRRPGGGGTGTTSSPGFVSGNPEAASQLMVHCSGTVAAMFAATLVGLITAANAKPKSAMLRKVAPALTGTM
jgi:hypothetical protein